MNKYGMREIDNLNEIPINEIDKNIHVIWVGKNKPDYFNKVVSDLIGLSTSDWTIYPWCDDEIALIKENADEYGKKVFEVAESMKEIAAYVDVIRIYLLYIYGGYYFDADFEIYKNLNELTHVNADFLFSNSTDYYYPSISNCFFAAKKNHPFLKHLLDRLIDKYENGTMDEWIVARTGPIFWGDSYVAYNGEINPVMLQMYYFYASKKGDSYICADEDGNFCIKELDQDYDCSFGKHLFKGNGTYETF